MLEGVLGGLGLLDLEDLWDAMVLGRLGLWLGDRGGTGTCCPGLGLLGDAAVLCHLDDLVGV
jgi:hypothetical protein